MADKKIALALSALVPVDEFIPLIDKTPDVFVFVMAGLAHCFGVMAIFLHLLFLLRKVSQFCDKSLIFRVRLFLCWERKGEIPNFERLSYAAYRGDEYIPRNAHVEWSYLG